MPDLPKGGRGKQAPYETTHYRIPVDIKPVVEKIASRYKELYLFVSEEEANNFLLQIDEHLFNTSNNTVNDVMNSLTISEQDVDQIAKEILNQKKSAKVTLAKFIKRVFGYDVL